MSKRGRIFVAGGAGYIGTHTCVELLNEGYEVVVYDNFSNSSAEALKRVETITGKVITLIVGDIRDEGAMREAMAGCDVVIHFAGLKAVGESVAKPLDYYDNNVHGTLCLLRAMDTNNMKTLVFSSSATVYGDPEYLPLNESHPLRTTNPYGRTKLVIEEILRDLYTSDPTWKIMILRYFNPVGAHKSGLIGEDPQGIPNNLMPFVAQTAVGRREKLRVFGADYSTHDGTGVRDYIHVVDLAQGHLKALQALNTPQCTALNLGTGIGYSVMDVVKAFEKASERRVPYTIAPRREGDIAVCYADSLFSNSLLGWRASRTLEDMCRDTWHFQSKNPNGYL
ncbi:MULTISPECIES: UDP-glucose 4-epimerase GalE [unclassified Sulfuricurvum]|uniref:UDP-glucose 4-epimerase GalE n=1 Tax=unclassified Sulfuricurvum TaxID=2632390 RepID=UPI00029973F1|nr:MULTISPECIES: UDP-glucose 4-epimerase GalE [unclassified Sulfuricurvum]AFV98037.1 UDP-glucose 4-epimerase [Candidatus Sulfuricurvum sp. RIFRC-1]HBM36357.1 UDP-glucose 4-epimerase GalE [Sulfuricurvum sp.]